MQHNHEVLPVVSSDVAFERTEHKNEAAPTVEMTAEEVQACLHGFEEVTDPPAEPIS